MRKAFAVRSQENQINSFAFWPPFFMDRKTYGVNLFMPGTIKTTSLSAHHQAPIYQCVGVGAAGALAKSVQAAEARPIQMTVEHYRTHTRKLTATREELQQVAAPSVEPPADPFSQIWDSSFKAQDQQLEQLLSDRLPSAEKEHLLRVKNTNETIRLISAVLSNYAI